MSKAVPLPPRMSHLPMSKRGYVVPWFVKWIDGEPDFRVMDTDHFLQAMRRNLCWVCGSSLQASANNPFVVGPLSTINRISAEPPSHVECARYSVRVCPFLLMPKVERRRNDGLDEKAAQGPGITVKKNPGIMAMWFARGFKTLQIERGVLFEMGQPAAVEWYREGRLATRAEVEDGFEESLKELRAISAQGHDEPEEQRRMETRVMRARRWFPRK